MSLELVPVTRAETRAFIREHHRNNPNPPAAEILRVGLALDGQLVAVGIAGRPLATAYCDGRTLEITRLAVADYVPNACSMLYGALWRAGRALGWRRALTYTRADESGASLRASGWTRDAELEARDRIGWDNRPNRKAQDAPTERVRWMIGASS